MQNPSKSKTPHPHRWWDPLSAFLLFAALQTTAARLTATRWTYDLSIVQTTTAIGIVFGILLGYSRFSKRTAALMATVYGLFAIPWQLGLTLGAGISWRERLASLAGRLGATSAQIYQQEAVTDNIFFVTAMAILFWVLTVHAGFVLTRDAHAWRIVVPTGIALFIIHFFANCPFPFDSGIFCNSALSYQVLYLPVFLFLALLLVARINYLKQVHHWQNEGIYVPPDVSYDLTRFAIAAVTIIVVLAWIIPVSAKSLPTAEDINRLIMEPLRDLRDRYDYLFAALSPSVTTDIGIYGEDMFLGRGAVLNDSIVMIVEAPVEAYSGLRYYWRARIYDEYTGERWVSNYDIIQSTKPNQFKLPPPVEGDRTTATFTFIPYHALTTLFVVPQPLWVSRPASITMVQTDLGGKEIVTVNADPYLRAYERYQVEASLSTVTVADLKAAGTDYPEWITERYLEVPSEITPRMRDLARQIAAGHETPYEIVEAVTSYLRNNIAYTKTIPQVPQGREQLDWFLFDLRQGFCNFYASSEVMMLRSLGIPARLSVGYLSGERQGGQESNIPGARTVSFVVRQRDSHAWPEVYFPGIGWIEFEPTASERAIVRPLGTNTDPAQSVRETPVIDDAAELLPTDEPTPTPATSGNNLPPSGAGGTLDMAFVLYGLSALVVGAVLLVSSLHSALPNWLAAWLTRRGIHPPEFVRRWADYTREHPLGGVPAGGGRRKSLTIFERWRNSLRQLPPLPVQLEQLMRRLGLQPPKFLQKWAYYSTLSSLSRSYLEINRALNRLGKKPAIMDTPAERAAELIRLLPQARPAIQLLLDEYQATVYGQHRADIKSTHIAALWIRQDSYLALFKRFLARIQKPFKPPQSTQIETSP